MTKRNLKDCNILLLGAGSIAKAMIRGLVVGQEVRAEQIYVTNRSDRDRLYALREMYGVQAVEDLWKQPEVIERADVVVLAVKPHDLLSVAAQLRPHLQEGAVVLSLAAGISTEAITRQVGTQFAVVRAMPNTACAVLESATAVCYGPTCSSTARELARQVLSQVGLVSEVEESAMDAVTGVSGSGPAYFYYMVEAMQAAAQAQGLSAEVARGLILQTLFGAGKMMQETGLDACELRRQVTSPNGTTMAGLHVLEQAGFTRVMHEVIAAATSRSEEMGRVYRG
ncbi:pyrroline-5-carboxylate reductase [Tumebacillus permanentifrigoris]|uniref:Pyrroline-5-carboxylate reductase n=1 Tax=Tumebacillus permanentifrigoris TaxID=378543 RepID=A0A316D663_9BACL|nr:pyrroline-5-carboxylate reductase [Tumebacillus permanentifrigoris]PWK09024.1 pyrroline-5-carboxylate reductase [Tumebacillus permanentifrigoris]